MEDLTPAAPLALEIPSYQSKKWIHLTIMYLMEWAYPYYNKLIMSICILVELITKTLIFLSYNLIIRLKNIRIFSSAYPELGVVQVSPDYLWTWITFALIVANGWR